MLVSPNTRGSTRLSTYQGLLQIVFGKRKCTPILPDAIHFLDVISTRCNATTLQRIVGVSNFLTP